MVKKGGREKPNIMRENNRLEGKTVELVILANFRFSVFSAWISLPWFKFRYFISRYEV